jgi:uncharacterized protein
MKIVDSAVSSSLLCAGLLAGGLNLTSLAQVAPKKVLIVTTTLEYHHSSIPTAEKVLGELADKSGAFTVEYARVEPNDPQFKGADGKPDARKIRTAITSVLAEKMSPAALKTYDLIIFANTTGNLPLPDKAAFLEWIKSGKGFVGMHAAADTFHGFAGYLDMLGAEFQTHDAELRVHPINQDLECPACAHLGTNWQVYDEIYQMKSFDPATFHGLLTLDKKPGGNHEPGVYPVAWCKEYGKGRVFYTSLGHREDIWDPNWTDPQARPGQTGRRNSKEVAEAYQKHILEGIKWALGMETWDVKPQKPIQ